MHHFRYKAINRAGCRVAGHLSGQDVDDVVKTLRHLNLQPVAVRSNELQYALSIPGSLFSLSLKTLIQSQNKSCTAIELCNALAELMKSGLPLDTALEQLQLSGSSTLTVLANDLLTSIRQGCSFSNAVSQETLLPDASCRVLAVAEKAGRLEAGLENIAIALEYQHNFKQRLWRSCAYPFFLFLSLGSLIVYLLVAVVPELLQFTEGLGSELALTARVMLRLGDWLVQWGMVVLALVVLAVSGFVVVRRLSQRFCLMFDRQLLILPISGSLMISIWKAQFFDELYLLIDAGVDLLEALAIIAAETSNQFLQLSVTVMRYEMEDGKTLAQAMRCAGVFTMVSVQSVTIAEQTGDYQQALRRLHQATRADMSASLEKFEHRIGPVMLGICGMLILWVVLAVIAPIYSAAIQAGALL